MGVPLLTAPGAPASTIAGGVGTIAAAATTSTVGDGRGVGSSCTVGTVGRVSALVTVTGRMDYQLAVLSICHVPNITGLLDTV